MWEIDEDDDGQRIVRLSLGKEEPGAMWELLFVDETKSLREITEKVCLQDTIGQTCATRAHICRKSRTLKRDSQNLSGFHEEEVAAVAHVSPIESLYSVQFSYGDIKV